MPTTYRDAPSGVYSLMKSVMAEHFPELAALDPPLEIEVLMATNYRGPAVKFAGAAATAKIKIVSAEERANDGPGLRLLIDKLKWEGLTDRQKEALLHHELSHLEPKYDTKSGQLEIDEYDLPLIKLKPDDWMLTGFEATVETFGVDALEHRAVMHVHEKLRQLVLPFVEASPMERVFAETVAEAAVLAAKSGLDLVTSRPGSTPSGNGFPEPERPDRPAPKKPRKPRKRNHDPLDMRPE